MVSVCLPSDALLQDLPSYLGFSYLGCGVSLHGCSLPRGYLLTASPPDLERAVAPLSPPAVLCWSSHDEIPHVQGNRKSSKMVGVAREHQRADTLKPQSQTTTQSDHTDHSLVYLNETKPCPVGPPKTDGSWWRDLTDVFHWRREWQTTSVFLP